MTVHLPDWYLATGRRVPLDAAATLEDLARAYKAHKRLMQGPPRKRAPARDPAADAGTPITYPNPAIPAGEVAAIARKRDWMIVARAPQASAAAASAGAEDAEPQRILLDRTMRVVCAHYSVTRREINSQRRTEDVVRPRQVAMYLAKALTPLSYPDIGRRLGGRDHTTILHAVKKIEKLIKSDRYLYAEIEYLKTRILTDPA